MDAERTRRDTSRRYRSRLREQHAAQTRERILQAARQLFETEGFAGTKITAIAAQADVSVQTVYSAFGSKAGLVRALVEQMEESASAAQWRDRIATESQPEKILEAFAQWTCAFFLASKPVLSAAQGAATELADLTDQGNRHRRQALRSLIDRLDTMSAVRPDLPPEKAVDRAWLVTGVDTFLDATDACGWSPQTYTSWLTETLVQQILAP